MANSKAPKHDFAPAWLKIPDHANQKASGAKLCEHPADKNGFYSNYARRGGGGRDDLLMSRGRQFSDFPAGYGGGMMMRGPPSRGYEPGYDDRHYGQTGDYYGGPAGYYGGYPPGAGYHQYSHHPSARYNNPYVNIYPSYSYGPYDMPHNDRYYSSGRQRRSSRGNDKDVSSTTRNSSNTTTPVKSAASNGVKTESTEASGKNTQEASNNEVNKDKTLDEDFPSLGGEGDVVEKTDKLKPSAGVWDKNSVEKITSNKKSDSKENSSQSSKDVKQSSNIYKALVPGKSGVKRSIWDSNKSGKDINSNTSVTVKPRESSTEAASSPIEILNTRTVTQPRKLADKKSDFLKALKQGHDLNSTSEDATHKCLENGMNGHHSEYDSVLDEYLTDLDISGRPANGATSRTHAPSTPNGVHTWKDGSDEMAERRSRNGSGDMILSSSLEAEQRLLREMGWSEDEDQNPITEEEMLEIKALQSQLDKMREKKNDMRKPCSLSSMWSPQHLPSTALEPADEDLSSSDSDSDGLDS